MHKMIKVILLAYVAVFVITGILVTYLSLDPMTAPPLLKELKYMIFLWHLVCWIVLGMLANYLWDLFNAGKNWSDIQLERLLLPLLVSPVVLYATWNLFLHTNKSISMVIELVAFQNGFFGKLSSQKQGPPQNNDIMVES